MTRYPNKNIGRWEDYGHVAMGAPDHDDDIQCTAEILAAQMGPLVHYNQCKELVPEWDGNDEPLCEEHSEDAQQMEAADLQRKQQQENE